MVQIWVLPVDVLPREAYDGKSPAVCGNCSHLGQGCYVQWPQLYTLWLCTKDQIPLLDRLGGHALLGQLIEGQSIRLGAAGDPLGMPLWLGKMLIRGSKMHTAYTHAWYNLTIPDLDGWKAICMASVDSEKEKEAAKALGWRTFRTIKGKMSLEKREIECLSDKVGLYCAACKLCDGNRRDLKYDIAINVHGSNLYRYKIDDFETHPKFEGVRGLISGFPLGASNLRAGSVFSPRK